MKKLILLDMDGPLVDFEGAFFERWRELYPERKFVLPEAREYFYIEDQYPEEYKDDIQNIFKTKGFVLKMKPSENALEGINVLEERGYVVKICTSPMTKSPNNISEKVEWIEKNMGKKKLRDLIITKDKTLVRGDYLIDDRPEVKGMMEPVWEHLLFALPFNRNVSSKKRVNWTEILQILQ